MWDNISKKKVLITGSAFFNYGAQAMLFVTVDEIRKRHPNAIIYFQTTEDLDVSEYYFTTVNVDWSLCCGGIKQIINRSKRLLKDIVCYAIGRKAGRFSSLMAINKLKDVDLILDISGFAIGSKWDFEHNLNYIYMLRYAKKNNIPIIMLPQSVGPFDFEKKINKRDSELLKKQFTDLLSYPSVIFARENEAIDCLKALGVEKNVRKSSDIVLQNNEIDIDRICKKRPNFRFIDLDTEDNVAVAPNVHLLDYQNNDNLYEMYRIIVECLISLKKNVYILRNAQADNAICSKIYSMFDSEYVHLIDDYYTCIEYDHLIKQFDFIIGSRFHGLVFAIRNMVPCIAIGWSVKYDELMASVGLFEYYFDISSMKKNDRICNSIDKLNSNISETRTIIGNHLMTIRQDNCFSQIDPILEKVLGDYDSN